MRYLILSLIILPCCISELTAQSDYAYAGSFSEKINEASTSTISSEEKLMLTVSNISDLLSRELEYPDQMISYGIEGSCMLVVNISKKGSIISYNIEDSMGLLFDKEIIRVLKESSYLISDKTEAQKNGLRFKVPIHFNF